MKGIRSFVIIPDFWKFLKVMSDSPPEGIVFVLAGIQSFKIG